MKILLTISLLCLVAPGGLTAQADQNLRIHFISGSAEYKSEESLGVLQRLLEKEFSNVAVTASWGRDKGKDLPGIEAMANADVAIIFSRRIDLPENQLAFIRHHIQAEKPMIGIRTASHAFQNFDIDANVFGGSYSGHGKDEPVVVSIAEGAGIHPILKGLEGLEGWNRAGKLYYNRKLGEKTTLLLSGVGQKSNLREPLAWTNTYGNSGLAFYTSLGWSADFENRDFIKMLINAIQWTTGRELKAK